MSLDWREQEAVEAVRETLAELRATERQVAMFSYNIRMNRNLTRDIFPDRIYQGANRFCEDAERWARKQTRWDMRNIIEAFCDDKAEYAVRQIKYLK